MKQIIECLQALADLPKTIEELRSAPRGCEATPELANDVFALIRKDLDERYANVDSVPDFGDISDKYDLEQMIDDEIDTKMDDTDFIRGEDLPCDIDKLASSESVRELEERVDNLESGSGLHDSVVEMAKTVDAIRENIRRMRDALTAALGE